jgi:hypothetical protein
MKPLDQCLERVNRTNKVYYFLVEYKSGSNPAKPKNLIYAQETLEFYRSLPDTAQPEIWFYIEVIIDGERFQAKKRLTEQDCERLISDEQFWQDEKRNLQTAVAARLMFEP